MRTEIWRRGALGLALACTSVMAGCVSVRAVNPPGDGGPHRQAYQPGKLFSPVVRTRDLLFLSGVIGAMTPGRTASSRKPGAHSTGSASAWRWPAGAWRTS